MSIVEDAFKGLYPDKEYNYVSEIKFSNKFSDYNSNVKKIGNRLVFGLSRKWKTVSREIVIGLLQDLILKLHHDSKKTINIDLYNNFVKSIHISVQKNDIDLVLKDCFDRVNSKYFYGDAELTNLVWGNFSKRKLASYNYHTDTIAVSSLFLNAPKEIVDYLVYHEILHKMLKFRASKTRTLHHSSEFRKMENSFEDHDRIEKEISILIRRRCKSITLNID